MKMEEEEATNLSHNLTKSFMRTCYYVNVKEVSCLAVGKICKDK